jgi:hypothetical protein
MPRSHFCRTVRHVSQNVLSHAARGVLVMICAMCLIYN